MIQNYSENVIRVGEMNHALKFSREDDFMTAFFWAGGEVWVPERTNIKNNAP